MLDLEIVDPAGFSEYKQLVIPLVEKYGGKYVVASDSIETLEGDCSPKRIVVIEFESSQRARQWHETAEYREVRKLGHQSAKTRMILVEGM